jgi:hypothetical protein
VWTQTAIVTERCILFAILRENLKSRYIKNIERGYTLISSAQR